MVQTEPIMDLRGKKVTILGFARSGMALAEMVLRLEGAPKISDNGPWEKMEALWEGWPLKNKVHKEFGTHSQAFIEESDLVVLSPGVRMDAPALQWAKAKNIPVMGEIELAWRFCRATVVAITGSNGKTTTTTLISQMLQRAGKKVCLCGNIGTPFSRFVLDLTPQHIVVMEISSFQLESIRQFRPHVAVFLNFSQNHLDRHKDLNEYFTAKTRIFMNQTSNDYAVLNYQDSSLRAFVPRIKSKVVYFNQTQVDRQNDQDNPNFLAAAQTAKILGVSEATCQEAIKNFKGVEHRQEWVRTIEGIDFINDSKATTVEAGRWALETTTKPMLMICGGKDKNLDFTVLRDVIPKKVKKMYVIGEARERIKKAFQDVVALEEAATLEAAVQSARNDARSGDCVVLCPMCASFDMFRDYEDRGRTFKTIVSRL